MSTLYTLDNPGDASRDYLATGELGPILHVRGGSMRRDLTLGVPTSKLPRYLLNWVESRVAGGTL
jgi:hypothetical protein